jgi:hypothetical protein
VQRRRDDRDTDSVFDWLSVALRCGLVVLVAAAIQHNSTGKFPGLHWQMRPGMARHCDDALNAILF